MKPKISVPPPLTADEAVRRIAALQSDGSGPGQAGSIQAGPVQAGPFPAGLFPSWRYHQTLPYRRPDANVFCTAITVFTLNGIRENLTPVSRQLVDEITEKAARAYPAYRCINRPTYNNYPARPDGHFTPGYVFHRFRQFRLPDDIDDTALVFLTAPHVRDDALALKEILPRHANGTQRWVQNTLPAYRSLRAYSTWFGKRMSIDLDVCALCNLFLLIFRENLPLNQWDHASLTFIREVILLGEYRQHPFDVSHHYPRPALIFYHVARLLAAYDPPQLEGCREKLLADGPKLLQEKKLEFFDRVLLSTSLRKLGGGISPLEVPTHFEEELHRYAFFIGCILTPLESPRFWYRLAHHPATHFRWSCPAHTLALWAEHLATPPPGGAF